MSTLPTRLDELFGKRTWTRRVEVSLIAFLIAFLAYLAAGVLLWIPLAVIGRRRRRAKTVRRYLIGAAVAGFICALIVASSERLVNQCEAAGNPGCFDVGSAGLQLLFIGGYGFAVLLAAFLIYRD